MILLFVYEFRVGFILPPLVGFLKQRKLFGIAKVAGSSDEGKKNDRVRFRKDVKSNEYYSA